MMNSILLWHSTMTGVWLCLAGFAALFIYIGIKEWIYYTTQFPKIPEDTPEQRAKDFLEFQKEVEEYEAIKKHI
ncbi:MAG: hypothetical protein J1E82_02035 [Muribaculaceae bacterium]|nr:hypothetical protein [Muribaculaceae bacterium]